jgi:predicted acetyltransferase
MMIFRSALEPDLDRLIDIHMAAFPDGRSVPERMRNFVENNLGTLDDLHVVEMSGSIVAHAFFFPLGFYFGGRRVSVGSVASVGVAPEARGLGVAHALIEHLHDRAHARGDAITLLYAFRQGFYSRLGYAPVTPTKLLSLSPASVPKEWHKRARASGLDVRSANGDDRPVIEALYARACIRGTGLLERPVALWNTRFADERRQWFVASRDGKAVGYGAWTLVQREAHARTRAVVRELIAEDHEARRALLSVLGAMRDQVSEVDLEVDATDPLDRALVDIDGTRSGTEAVEHPLGIVVGGPMVRIVDAERAILARGYAHDGAIDLELEGSAEPLRLRVANGQARLDAEGNAPRLRLDSHALAALLYGGLRTSEAIELGWVASESAHAVAAADTLLAMPAFFSLDPF